MNPAVFRYLPAVSILLGACGEPLGVGDCGDARSLDAALRLPPVTEHQTIDDLWAEVARQVPGGWGGLFLSEGQPTIYLVEPGKSAEATIALYELGIGQPLLDVRDARVLKGRWDFAQLYDWYRYLNVLAWTVDSLVFTDIDEADNRLHYGVQAAARDELEEVLASLDPPCDLIVVELAEPSRVGSNKGAD